MIDVGFLGDPHFGHRAIAKIRGFDDIDEYNQVVIDRINAVMGKRSLLYLVGDITMEEKKSYHLLSKITARIKVILGNHDLGEHVSELLKYVETVSGAMKYKDCMVTHIPMHAQEVSRFKINIHAHTHEETIKRLIYQANVATVRETRDQRYKCVSWDLLEGTPISFSQIKKEYGWE